MTPAGPDRLQASRRTAVVAALALTVIGVLFVHSTTADGAPFPSPTARGQILKALLALAAFAVVSRIDYRIVERFSYAIYGGVLAVLIFMVAARGPASYLFLKVGALQIQPSELMKVALVIALARYLRFREDQRSLRGLLAPFAITAVPMFFVLRQPDLGTSLMLPPVFLGMLYVAGARPRILVAAILLGAASLVAAYCVRDSLAILKPYQLQRIESFVRPIAEGREASYHAQQSVIAIGSGGSTGKGYGRGTQSTFRWLPESHTDFIYSVIGEEWGFVGAAGVALLFLVLVLSLLRIAILTREPFGRLVVTGIAVAIAAQSLENMGMTMGLTPITGVPLPFVSHGGSSLLTSALSLAVAASVARTRVRVVASADLAPKDARREPLLVPRPAAALLRDRWAIE